MPSGPCAIAASASSVASGDVSTPVDLATPPAVEADDVSVERSVGRVIDHLRVDGEGRRVGADDRRLVIQQGEVGDVAARAQREGLGPDAVRAGIEARDEPAHGALAPNASPVNVPADDDALVVAPDRARCDRAAPMSTSAPDVVAAPFFASSRRAMKRP